MDEMKGRKTIVWKAKFEMKLIRSTREFSHWDGFFVGKCRAHILSPFHAVWIQKRKTSCWPKCHSATFLIGKDVIFSPKSFLFSLEAYALPSHRLSCHFLPFLPEIEKCYHDMFRVYFLPCFSWKHFQSVKCISTESSYAAFFSFYSGTFIYNDGSMPNPISVPPTSSTRILTFISFCHPGVLKCYEKI